MQLEDASALVTGGASGLGAATAQQRFRTRAVRWYWSISLHRPGGDRRAARRPHDLLPVRTSFTLGVQPRPGHR